MVMKLTFKDGMIISFFPKVHFLQIPCFQTLDGPYQALALAKLVKAMLRQKLYCP